MVSDDDMQRAAIGLVACSVQYKSRGRSLLFTIYLLRELTHAVQLQ